jgi:serine/threonine protein kinase
MLMPSSGYMAPEYLYRGEISAQSDIYSLGVIMMEITTREQNSSGNDQPSARKFIEKVRRNIIQLFVKLKFKIILHFGLYIFTSHHDSNCACRYKTLGIRSST